MSRMPIGRLLLLVAGLAILATVAAAVWVMGGPGAQRQLRLDERRLQDLNQLQGLVDGYALEHKALPADLATLQRVPGQALSFADPVTGVPYEYRVVAGNRYQLCAVFITDSAEQQRAGGRWQGPDWTHARGRHCFTRDVEQAVLKPAPAAQAPLP